MLLTLSYHINSQNDIKLVGYQWVSVGAKVNISKSTDLLPESIFPSEEGTIPDNFKPIDDSIRFPFLDAIVCSGRFLDVVFPDVLIHWVQGQGSLLGVSQPPGWEAGEDGLDVGGVQEC